MDAIVQALIVWISANSQYSVDNVALPTVVFMTPKEITEEYYSDVAEHIPGGGVDDRIWALYEVESNENGVIYLRIDTQLVNNSASDTMAEWQRPRIGVAQSAFSHDVDRVTYDSESESYEPLFTDDRVLTERLLHELVHHLQFQTGVNKTFKCLAYSELEAYRLGGLYFKRRHIEDPMPNRNFWAPIYSRC